MANNYNIQTGRLYDKNGKNFDITVILNFPTQADYENATGLDDFPSVNLIDFYFGDTNDGDTECYVNQFVEKQNKLRKLISTLIDLSTDENESEIAEQIEFVKSLIVTLH
jgi:predicted PolB exonuclease-like 3'-5' exonuclease